MCRSEEFGTGGILGTPCVIVGHRDHPPLVQLLRDAEKIAKKRRDASKMVVDPTTCRSPYVSDLRHLNDHPQSWTYCGFAHIIVFIYEIDTTGLTLIHALLSLLQEGEMTSMKDPKDKYTPERRYWLAGCVHFQLWRASVGILTASAGYTCRLSHKRCCLWTKCWTKKKSLLFSKI